MRVKSLHLNKFKRFDDLKIDLWENPKKIIAMIGPNGCGKSSVFDAFEEYAKNYRSHGQEDQQFYSKAFFYEDETQREKNYDHGCPINN